ncbi:uncharacterized protein LOC112569271 [Pomacea canaliculata]|uniref:uncharacterized protein LOC112569271 n=1 Tax=Pomacea canaliculata TaxID=400727 RepID=UPI000D726BA8|nr:uncharacterized protein LOC112569271 [Pomacea canaliculata]
MWRRGWMLPCARDGVNERRQHQNQMNGDSSDRPLSSAISKACTSREVVAQETSLYAGLKMQDVGKRSHYEEIQRYQNAPAMSPYEVVSDTSGTDKEEHSYVN